MSLSGSFVNCILGFINHVYTIAFFSSFTDNCFVNCPDHLID